MSRGNQKRGTSWRMVVVTTAVGCLVSSLIVWTGNEGLPSIFLGTLLSFLAALVWHTAGWRRSVEPSLLETPFYLAHDAEVFDRYRRLAQALLQVSGRSDLIYRKVALETLDTSISNITTIGEGKIVFEETEVWRLVYEKLLRDPSVTVYRSVAFVRNPAYWQDGAGSQSMQLNYLLLSQSLISIERTVILADDLWPTGDDLPTESMRQWIHEQSTRGIQVRLVREPALQQEPDLVRDMGIYGFSAVGFQEFDADHLRTRRFTLDFDFTAVREAGNRWDRLNVYASSYKDLRDHFCLVE